MDVSKSKIEFPMVPRIEGSLRLQLKLLNANIVHTKCCGYLCDSIGMKTSDGDWRERCPCYTTQRQLGNVLFDLDLSVSVMTKIGVDNEEGKVLEKFQCKNFTSRSFTSLVTEGGFPVSVSANMLAETCADAAIFEKVELYLDQANKKRIQHTRLDTTWAYQGSGNSPCWFYQQRWQSTRCFSSVFWSDLPHYPH